MSYGHWKPYVPVATRRAQAAKAAAKAKKGGKEMAPVAIDGRSIARTFWGKAWCDNLEAYSDFANRLPRGRTYVRNGSVIDLQIEPGKVKAQVMGSSLYRVEIGIASVSQAHWKTLAKECTGAIASLVELLQGKLSKAVMQRICEPKSGLFPAPKDIRFDCSCPDSATMCKHVAATLYGVGARLDGQPELLFALRQVDAGELVAQASVLPVATKRAQPSGKVLDDALLADVFGIEMAAAAPPVAKKKTGTRTTKPAVPRPIEAPTPVKAATTKKRISAKPKEAVAPTPSKPAKPDKPARSNKKATPV